MPQVIIIMPDNISFLVINVSSFQLADLLYYFNIVTVCNYLWCGVECDPRSIFLLQMHNWSLHENSCFWLGDQFLLPNVDTKKKKKSIFRWLNQKNHNPQILPAILNPVRQCLKFSLQCSGLRNWSPVGYFNPWEQQAENLTYPG